MGLETFLHRKDDSILEISEDKYGYWCRCFGIDDWLSKISDNPKNPECIIQVEKLKQLLEPMKKRIDKMIEIVNQLGYVADNPEELRLLICDLRDEDNYEDYHKIEKCIKGFNVNGLNYNSFEDSSWGSIHTFILTYKNFEKIVNLGESEIKFVSSY